MKGRPPKTNAQHALSGSNNGRIGETVSLDLKDPHIPPSHLSEDAQKQWRLIVPSISAGEADRVILCVLCTCLSRFYNEKVDSNGSQIVDEKERRSLTKTILDISDKFGMNPLSRQRSGISKKQLGVKQRP